jgi:competence protein ComEC
MATSLAIPQQAPARAPAQTAPVQPPKQDQPTVKILGAPALFMAVCFACGDAIAHWLWLLPGHLITAIALLVIVAIVAAFRASRIAPLAAAILCAFLGLFSAEVQRHAPSSTPLERIAFATPTSTPFTRRLGIETTHTIEGAIIRATPLRQIETFAPYSDIVRHEHSQQIDLRVITVDGRELPAPEGLRLTLYAPADAPFPQLACGRTLSGPVAMHTEERFLDPGVWDASAWLRQQGISALGSGHAEDVAVTVTNAGHSFPCWLHSIQQAASERLLGLADQPVSFRLPQFLSLSYDDAAMLTAMLTGDRTLLGHRLRVGFERTGSFHLFVVSGMHLAIFAGLVLWIAGHLHLPRASASAATIALSLAYAHFTGFGQPVQRAFWMVTLYLCGRMLWRERHPLNAIGFAALVMLAVNPAALLDAGFQMTLLSVLAVAGIAVPIAERTFGPYLRATPMRWLIGPWLALRILPRAVRIALLIVELVTTSLAIELFMALPMAIYFHRITAVALPVNILIVPLLGVLLPLALATLLLVVTLPKLAAIPAAAVALLLHGVTALVHALRSHAPRRSPHPPHPAARHRSNHHPHSRGPDPASHSALCHPRRRHHPSCRSHGDNIPATSVASCGIPRNLHHRRRSGRLDPRHHTPRQDASH